MNHLKYYLFLALWLCLSVFCFAQKDDPNYKDLDQLKLEEVRDKLLKGFGFQSSFVPDIQFRDKSDHLAGYTKNIITIGGDAYNILKNRGLLDEGLALLIGHELGHFDLDTIFQHRQFSVMSLDMDNYLSAECDGQCQKMEAFCDYFGCFAAHRAGYDIWNKADEIIQVICETYTCTETNTHLSEQDRRDALRKLQKSVEDMSHLFDVAYRMTLIGEYEKAQKYYGIIEKTFPSREIKNNKALNTMLQGLSLMKGRMRDFSYPFELDNETRLREGVRAKSDEEAKKSERLINTAIQVLEPITGRHDDYTPALFNLGCAYLLADKTTMAKEKFGCIRPVNKLMEDKVKMGKALADYIGTGDKTGLKYLEKNAATPYLKQAAKLNLTSPKDISDKIQSDPQKCKDLNKYQSPKVHTSRKLLDTNIQFQPHQTSPLYCIDNTMTLYINDPQLQLMGKSKNQIESDSCTSPFSTIPSKSGVYYLYKNIDIVGNYDETTGLVIQVDSTNKVIEYFMYYVD